MDTRPEQFYSDLLTSVSGSYYTRTWQALASQALVIDAQMTRYRPSSERAKEIPDLS